ncbi:hypothetical protein EAG_10930 [Camponotus floridanus]|uniref:Uncharacterized protein n=1 Tax=Camponotus floridanus TaxID=104421 RepID=E2ALR4_CAMFO|nr:hypothetical protein EAG_10930 [Camponotus floridanus]
MFRKIDYGLGCGVGDGEIVHGWAKPHSCLYIRTNAVPCFTAEQTPICFSFERESARDGIASEMKRCPVNNGKGTNSFPRVSHTLEELKFRSYAAWRLSLFPVEVLRHYEFPISRTSKVLWHLAIKNVSIIASSLNSEITVWRIFGFIGSQISTRIREATTTVKDGLEGKGEERENRSKSSNVCQCCVNDAESPK